MVDLLPKLRLKTQALSYDECHFIVDLLKEGIPLSKTLLVLRNSLNQMVVDEMISHLEKGDSISSYFFKTKDNQAMFDFFQSLYSLPEALEHCLNIVDTRNKLVRNLLTKLIYPTIILLVSCICLLFVCFLVMPRIANLIAGMGLEQNKTLYWICMVLCLVLTASLVFVALLSVGLIGAFVNHQLAWVFEKGKIAIFQNFLKFIFTFFFCSYFNVLLQRHVSTQDALILLSGVKDGITDKIALHCRKSMEEGKELASSLYESGYILESYYSILCLGEVSNQILNYSLNYERLSMMKLEKGVKWCIYGAQGLSYVCVAFCAVVVMQLLMSPLQLFDLL